MIDKISPERAIYEAFQFTTAEPTRYDLDLVEVGNIVATNGKSLYCADVYGVKGFPSNCYLSKESNFYKPRKAAIGNGFYMDGDRLAVCGTMFTITDNLALQEKGQKILFPPWRKVAHPQAHVAFQMDTRLFESVLATLASSAQLYRRQARIENDTWCQISQYAAFYAGNNGVYLVCWHTTGDSFFDASGRIIVQLLTGYVGDELTVVFDPKLYHKIDTITHVELGINTEDVDVSYFFEEKEVLVHRGG